MLNGLFQVIRVCQFWRVCRYVLCFIKPHFVCPDGADPVFCCDDFDLLFRCNPSSVSSERKLKRQNTSKTLNWIGILLYMYMYIVYLEGQIKLHDENLENSTKTFSFRRLVYLALEKVANPFRATNL